MDIEQHTLIDLIRTVIHFKGDDVEFNQFKQQFVRLVILYGIEDFMYKNDVDVRGCINLGPITQTHFRGSLYGYMEAKQRWYGCTFFDKRINKPLQELTNAVMRVYKAFIKRINREIVKQCTIKDRCYCCQKETTKLNMVGVKLFPNGIKNHDTVGNLVCDDCWEICDECKQYDSKYWLIAYRNSSNERIYLCPGCSDDYHCCDSKTTEDCYCYQSYSIN